MSKRDIWGVVMLIVTVLGAIGGVATKEVTGGDWVTFFLGCGIVYWIGTGFIKDDPPEDQDTP